MNGLPNCDKKDSQGICFLGKIKIQDFLREFIEEKPGDIINAQGKTVGRHKGLFNYTIGQRKGIGVPSNTDNKNYVVVAKDFENNVLRIDFDSPTQPDLWKTEVEVENINWINKELAEETEIEVYAEIPRRSCEKQIHAPFGRDCKSGIFRTAKGNRKRTNSRALPRQHPPWRRSI